LNNPAVASVRYDIVAAAEERVIFFWLASE
jgi:hypothetical protein